MVITTMVLLWLIAPLQGCSVSESRLLEKQTTVSFPFVVSIRYIVLALALVPRGALAYRDEKPYASAEKVNAAVVECQNPIPVPTDQISVDLIGTKPYLKSH